MAIIVQATSSYDSRCPPSYAVFGAIIINASVFIYLFSNFYIQAYLKNRKDIQNLKLSLNNGTKHTNGVECHKIEEKVQ